MCEELDQYNVKKYEKSLLIPSEELSSIKRHKSFLCQRQSYTSISSCFSSSSDAKSTETTKSVLIQRILDSFKPTLNLKSSSDSTTNTSLSFLDQSLHLSNKIYIHFNNKNELGLEPTMDDLLEIIEYNKNCSHHRLEIIFSNHLLNQQLSYKQKQSILRVILRRQQIFDRHFSLY